MIMIPILTKKNYISIKFCYINPIVVILVINAVFITHTLVSHQQFPGKYNIFPVYTYYKTKHLADTVTLECTDIIAQQSRQMF